MVSAPDPKRIDAASRIIKATPQAIYQAFLNPSAIAVWRPPQGMRGHIHKFEPYAGGTFRMSFEYVDAGHSLPGKTSENADVFEGQFLELIPGSRIVESVIFESDDPAFAGEMIITTTLVPVEEGTEVTFACGNVPAGISHEDHVMGIRSSLENLASFVE